MSTQMGRYVLERKLGAGGMAEVWLATQLGPTGFKRRCVVKRVLSHLTEDAEFIQMFLDEARLAAQLNHPNIVQILDFGEHEGSYFLAMEYVPGTDLRNLLNEQWTAGYFIPYPLVARIASLVAQALDFAHHAVSGDGQPLKVVHRDVSPHNILLSSAGMVKLIDFGIAKAATSRKRTETGMIKGKTTYMSPEQLHGKPLDGRSDLFALGLVLYELLAGKHAVPRESEPVIIQTIVNARFEPLSRIRPDIPKALQAVVERALQKAPDARYARGSELSMDLERYIVSSGAILSPADLAVLVPANDAASGPHPQPPAVSGPPPTREVRSVSREMPLPTRDIRSVAGEAPPRSRDMRSSSLDALPPLTVETAQAPPRTVASRPASASQPVAPPTRTEVGLPRSVVQRRRTVGLAVASLGLAAVGGLAFGLARFAPRPAQPTAAAVPIAPPLAKAPEAVVPTPPPPPILAQPPVTQTAAEVTPTRTASRHHRTDPAKAESAASLTVRSEVPARVSVDGEGRGLAPIFISTDPGDHIVTYASDLLRITHTEKVHLGPGEEREETWHPGRGIIQFWVMPYAEVFLDGRSLGTTPLPAQEVWEGHHTLRFRNADSGRSEQREIDVAPDSRQTVKINLGAQ